MLVVDVSWFVDVKEVGLLMLSRVSHSCERVEWNFIRMKKERENEGKDKERIIRKLIKMCSTFLFCMIKCLLEGNYFHQH